MCLSPKGHKACACPNQHPKRLWCSYCKSSMHKDARQWETMLNKPLVKRTTTNTHLSLKRMTASSTECNERDWWWTRVRHHTLFGDIFQLEKHCVELADRTKTSGVALRRGDAEVCLIENEGQQVKVFFSTSQDIFSVKAAMTNGASINFQQGCNKLKGKTGKSSLNCEICSQGKFE